MGRDQFFIDLSMNVVKKLGGLGQFRLIKIFWYKKGNWLDNFTENNLLYRYQIYMCKNISNCFHHWFFATQSWQNHRLHDPKPSHFTMFKSITPVAIEKEFNILDALASPIDSSNIYYNNYSIYLFLLTRIPLHYIHHKLFFVQDRTGSQNIVGGWYNRYT